MFRSFYLVGASYIYGSTCIKTVFYSNPSLFAKKVQPKTMDLKIISAGAGSGKTYRLTKEMVELLASKKVKANGIIATTFTNKAAAELRAGTGKVIGRGLSRKPTT
ncbi:MAG: UvrD-helicase domain-containing protein [Saprospiraceae bacterium]